VKVLFLPLLIILLPMGILFLILKYWSKQKDISLGSKIGLGLVFSAFGIWASFYAMFVSMEGMVDKGIICTTGTLVVVPFGVLINAFGVPLLLFLFKGKSIKN